MKSLNIKNNLVNHKENTHLEFKESFSKYVRSYIRTICAFANYKGGEIIFGVKDRPKIPIGLKNKLEEFNDYDNKELSTHIQDCLSINIDFDFSSFTQKINDENLTFGVLKVKESFQKPVICKISDQKCKLREGAIYFRYNGKNDEIKAQDLIYLIQQEKNKEKELWIKNIQKMAQIGISKAGVFSYDGEIFAGEKRVIIDKNVIDKIKFIKEGEFVEKKGSPALILKGEIKNFDSLEIVEVPIDPNKTHPFESFKSVENEIKILLKDKIKDNRLFISSKNKNYTIYYILSEIKKHFNLEDDTKYCWKNKKGNIKQYSDNFIKKCLEIINSEKKLDNVFNN